MLIAGNDTTAATIANEVLQAADDEPLLNRLVEEVLRVEPHAHGLFRTAMRDVELSGTVIPTGSQVFIMFASANDDESEFPYPRKIDLARPNAGRHLAFGAGTHRCIGAALSRMELKIAATEIVKRLGNIELAIPVEEVSYLPNVAMQTIERLPLTFSRRTTAS